MNSYLTCFSCLSVQLLFWNILDLLIIYSSQNWEYNLKKYINIISLEAPVFLMCESISRHLHSLFYSVDTPTQHGAHRDYRSSICTDVALQDFHTVECLSAQKQLYINILKVYTGKCWPSCKQKAGGHHEGDSSSVWISQTNSKPAPFILYGSGSALHILVKQQQSVPPVLNTR